MKIISIEWRNIGSFGDKIQKIEFKNDGCLWQLYGRSGYGKSTILSLPALAFYGKIPKVKIGNIANRINKNGWIRCVVINGTDKFEIERTFSPNSLKLKRNGEVIDKANSKELENIIENEIVSMPYQIFSNVISLSLNNFKSFIDMTPNDKRQIIDKIFCLDALNKAFEIVKKDEKELAVLITSLDNQIYSIEQTIKTSENELEKLRSDNSNIDYETEINNINILIAQIDEQIKDINEKKKTNNEALVSAQTERNKIYQMYIQYDNHLTTIIKQIELYNGNKCPTCGSEFIGDKFDDIKTTLINKKNEVEIYLSQLKGNLETFDNYIKKASEVNATINQNYINLTYSRGNYVATLNGLNVKRNSPNQFSAIENIISNAKDNKIKLEIESIANKNKMDNIQYLNNLYAQNGIVKQQIMNNYIPALNEDIRNILINFSFPYILEFDNNFDPHLFDMSEEIEVSTLSVGEQKRVDIAVLCAIIKMIKNRFPQINMICLDETVSSMDTQTAEDIISILMDISHNLAMNIFVVSHIMLPENYFDEKILVVKETGFSDIIIENKI
jgi:DNA repair exonuclease SbcCD ATPase subunit